MLPAERQKYIREVVQTRNHVKITELSKLLDVSDMTVHRDVKPLIDEGVVVKTFGGISANKQHSPKETNTKTCIFCSRNIHERMAFHLILTDHTMETACCAHCGLLRYKQLGKNIEQAISHDFLRETTIDAHMAWYVMDTSLNMSCCTPQVLTFAHEEHAKQFVKGFGGNIYSFSNALDCLHKKMTENREQCHSFT